MIAELLQRFRPGGTGWRAFPSGRWSFRACACVMILLASAHSATAVPLTNLLAGSSIIAGNSRFANWQLVSVDGDGAAPDLSLVSVNPIFDLANPGIQFVGNNQLSIAGGQYLDLVLKYRVHALPFGNTFEGHSLSITGITFGGGGGVAMVSDGLDTGLGANLDSAVAIGDPASDVLQFSDEVSFSPQSSLFVTTSIFLNSIAAGDSITLATFNHRFAQTGSLVLEGDYNENGIVDAADYTVWRDKLGSPAGTLPNDTSGTAIGLVQYNSWKANFGNTSGAGAGVVQNVAVPEPKSFVTLLVTLLSMCRLRYVRR